MEHPEIAGTDVGLDNSSASDRVGLGVLIGALVQSGRSTIRQTDRIRSVDGMSSGAEWNIRGTKGRSITKRVLRCKTRPTAPQATGRTNPRFCTLKREKGILEYLSSPTGGRVLCAANSVRSDRCAADFSASHIQHSRPRSKPLSLAMCVSIRRENENEPLACCCSGTLVNQTGSQIGASSIAEHANRRRGGPTIGGDGP